MGDFWPTLPGQFSNYWEAPAHSPAARLLKGLLRPLALKMLAREKQPVLLLEHVIYPSLFMKSEFERRGILPDCTEVIYGSVDTSPYLGQSRSARVRDGVSLLYVGRLTPEKGVHTTIEALGHLVLRLGIRKAKLTIIGEGNQEYLRRLRELSRERGIEPLVTFLPMQPKEALPGLYQEADVFLFPSIWAEPFGRVIVEAMASGLPVVGTRVGGAAELLLEEETALVFPPEDALGLALQVKRLIDSPELREGLSRRGREFAVSRFDTRRMTDEIEASLMKVAGG
jgi:glycosyltransferase involved in cell wall biosynthesis